MGEKTQTYLDNTGQNHYNYFAKMVFVCAPRNFAGAKERNDLNMANMKKEYKMSAERKEELQKELTYLKTVREKEVADLIKEARGFGDLSENSEYDEAKNEQAIVEARILTLENQLKNVKIIEKSDTVKGTVSLGSFVTIRDVEFGDEMTYRIISSVESSNDMSTITDESPVGKALLGHKAGETVEVTIPSGAQIEYQIIKVE